MWKNKTLLLILVLAIAIFFRLWQINSIPPGLYPDEAMNGNNALEAIRNGEYKIFYPENNGREGLFINIQSISIRIFGNKPWALRIVSALFGIFTVLGLYLLTKELFHEIRLRSYEDGFRSKRIALFASFFLATSLWHIIFSRIGFRAIMAPAFLVWSFWLLFRIINRAKKANPNYQILNSKQNSNSKAQIPNKKQFWKLEIDNWKLPILSGLVFGLGFHSYIAYRAAPLLLIPPFLILIKNKNIKPIILFLIGAFIAGLPLGLYFLNNPQDFFGRTLQISVFSSESPLLELGKNIAKTIGMFFFVGDFNWRHNYAGAPQLWWPVAILFLIGILVSIKNIVKIWNFKIWNLRDILSAPETFLLIWLVVMLLPVVISSESLPHALRAISVVPVAMIFSAIGLQKIVQQFPQKSKILVSVLFAAIFFFTYNQYFIDWTNNYHVQGAFAKDYLETGEILNSLSKDVPKYVIIEAQGIDVRGIPMPSQTTMFITKTFLPEWQKEKNIYYILPDKINEIPGNAIKLWIR